MGLKSLRLLIHWQEYIGLMTVYGSTWTVGEKNFILYNGIGIVEVIGICLVGWVCTAGIANNRVKSAKRKIDLANLPDVLKIKNLENRLAELKATQKLLDLSKIVPEEHKSNFTHPKSIINIYIAPAVGTTEQDAGKVSRKGLYGFPVPLADKPKKVYTGLYKFPEDRPKN